MKRNAMVPVLLLALSAAAQAQLLNGSFEQPVIGVPFQSFGNGSVGLTGWSVFGSSVGDSVALIEQSLAAASFGSPLAQQASEGAQWLDLTGQGGADTPSGGALGGGVEQTVLGLVDGSTYTLSFDVGAIGLQGANSAVVDVRINNVLLPGIYSSSGAGAAWENTWTSYSVDFTAAAGPNTISFTGNNLGGAPVSIGLDKVQLVPEPQAYALAAAGLGLVGFVARRRRRRG